MRVAPAAVGRRRRGSAAASDRADPGPQRPHDRDVDDNPDQPAAGRAPARALPALRLFAARKGREGVELIRAHAPDVILLDLHLSDGDGRELLGELRRDPLTAAIPVVVLSAAATPTRRNGCGRRRGGPGQAGRRAPRC